VKTYFSGPYQRHRFNIQAIVDNHLGCFLYIAAVAAPGNQPGNPAQPVDGISAIREALVKRVREAGLTRP
jgi:hypothetical protein